MAREPDKRANAAKASVRKEPCLKDTDMDSPGPPDPIKDEVTEGSEESFPASDPPSFMGGGIIAGSPSSRPVETIPAPKKPKPADKGDKKHD